MTRHAIPAPQYRVVIPTTGIVLRAVADLSRAKAIAAHYCRWLAHPVYAPTIIVERVGPDGKRRKVWSPPSADLAIPGVTG